MEAIMIDSRRNSLSNLWKATIGVIDTKNRTSATIFIVFLSLNRIISDAYFAEKSLVRFLYLLKNLV